MKSKTEFNKQGLPVYTTSLIANRGIWIKFEIDKKIYSQNDVERLSAFAYFYNLGLTAKNFTIMKSLADRGLGFFDTLNTASVEINKEDLELSIKYFTLIVGSYILEDL